MNPTDLAARLIDLEMKFAFLEEHIAQQDREILKLRTLFEKQSLDLAHLRSQQGGDGAQIRGDERPPHY